MLDPGTWAHYTRTNGDVVVAQIVGVSPDGDQYRTISYARPSAHQDQVYHVTHNRAKIADLQALKVVDPPPPSPGTPHSCIKY